MGTRLRIGVVGLGSIAQKAWLPVLGAAESWTLQAAWSPGKEKALRICETWRMPYADSLDALAAQCDAVFVHTSTASHYEVVNHLLNAGVHVCVDKPLADKLSEAETLVELAARRRLTLMVGFNRRFAPLYRELKGGWARRPRCGWINTVAIASATICALRCLMTICMWWIPRYGWPTVRHVCAAAR
ncbi:oxidoreductase family, NAD-binding [Klebsiella pneumoniae]|uniref:Oxidoreductase family, NAD-binding n=1 Tax=Klebsiella pneumoniae TaxID=573 RepID=A0A2X3EHA2_KLEPN|nr:oxidoreductase family, NAD-binding [Klebsiella pneumoniae]